MLNILSRDLVAQIEDDFGEGISDSDLTQANSHSGLAFPWIFLNYSPRMLELYLEITSTFPETLL